jgi:hypothetical protein
MLEEPASDPQSHLASQSGSSCDWVNSNEPALARGSRKTAGPITNNAAKVGRIKACVSIDT